MAFWASDHASRATSLSQTADHRTLLALTLRDDTLEITPDSLIVARNRWGLRNVIPATDVRAFGYRHRRFGLSSALRIERHSRPALRFAVRLRPYEAEQALDQIRQSGLWLATRLENPQRGVFVTSPSAP